MNGMKTIRDLMVDYGEGLTLKDIMTLTDIPKAEATQAFHNLLLHGTVVTDERGPSADWTFTPAVPSSFKQEVERVLGDLIHPTIPFGITKGVRGFPELRTKDTLQALNDLVEEGKAIRDETGPQKRFSLATDVLPDPPTVEPEFSEGDTIKEYFNIARTVAENSGKNVTLVILVKADGGTEITTRR